MRFLKSSFLLSFLLISVIGFSQTAATQDSIEFNNLESQFQQMKKEANDYQIYKVVKKVDLDRFWKVVEDSLHLYQSKIERSNSKIVSLSSEVKELSQEVNKLDSNLTNQEYAIHHLSFMGMNMTKGGYKTLSWLIIGVLLLIIVILFIRFKTANRITQKTKLSYSDLEKEFDAHRKRAMEKETNIKRELQTAINTLHEMNQKPGKK